MAAVYRNLKAEQARNGYTNEYVANYLGMSRGNYEAKLRNGRFFASEVRKLCFLFSCDFNYLFAPLDEPEKAS